jgi:uncharacterized membrane protein
MTRPTPVPDERDMPCAGANMSAALAGAHPPPTLLPHSPRVKAALCYTVPLVPALYLLTHERRNRFLRLHAAQSLVFHALVGLAQVLLFAVVVVLGGAITSTTGALVAAAALFAVFATLTLVVAVTWTHLVAECIRGRSALLPLVGGWALWVEACTAREVWARSREARAGTASPRDADDAASDTPPPAS